MPMPGGWTMSMAWMRMPGQSWPAAAATFAGMWIAMMAPMMLPSLMPMLRRYRRNIGAIGRVRCGALTAIVTASYFAVWAVCGLAVFPIATAAVVLAAGALQLTAWKARQLALPGAGARTGAGR